MTFMMSKGFAAALDAHKAAYAAFDVLAEAGADNTPEYEAASNVECAALDAVFYYPAVNAADVGGKLALMYTKERDVSDWDDMPKYLAALQADMLNLQRPNPSPEMAAAFDRWAASRIALDTAEYEENGQLPQAVRDEEEAAFMALFEVKNVGPGDHIVKHFADLIFDVGAYRGGFALLLVDWTEDGKNQILGDLRDTDLGKCMMALGRTDFDAEAWISAMDQVGGAFYVMHDNSDDGARTFWQAADTGDDPVPEHIRLRHRILQELLGGPMWRERTKAVCDAIDANHPQHRMSANRKCAIEQGDIDPSAPQPGIRLEA